MTEGKLGAPNATPSSGSSRRSTIDTLFVRKTEPTNNAVSSDKERVRTGAISAMGTSLQELTESAQSAQRLQRQIDTGAAVIEIEPGDVDASMVTDRLAVDVDPSFDELVESMRTAGQQVPILVRPNPAAANRYQIAYGRRRLRAAAKLGLRVKAVVRPLTDDELVVAQGKENLDRKDLSFIEKALFARRLEDRGFERAVIMSALSTDKADLSRYIAVARSIPEQLAHAIGPAGKAGRARWTAFAEKLSSPRSEKAVDAVVGSEEFTRLDSDARFAMLFAAVENRTNTTTPKARQWTNVRGQKAARVEHRPDRTILTIDDKMVPDFGHFVADRLDELYDQFQRHGLKGQGG